MRTIGYQMLDAVARHTLYSKDMSFIRTIDPDEGRNQGWPPVKFRAVGVLAGLAVVCAAAAIVALVVFAGQTVDRGVRRMLGWNEL